MDIWLSNTQKPNYKELRLYAPKSEKIKLTFYPLKLSDKPDWNPQWEEWHCYFEPLTVYCQDYEKLLMLYFNQLYPTKDAFLGTSETYFDVCFDNWLGQKDWERFILEIENDFNNFSANEKIFFIELLGWIKTALKYTSIIVVEGNL